MKRYAVAILLALAVVLAACGGPATTAAPAPTEAMEEPTEVMEEPTEAMEEPTEEPMEEPTEYPADEITLGFGGNIPISHPGVYVPQVMGFYADENLTVNVQPNDGSGQSLQLLDAGQVDFAQVAPESMIIARQQGIPVVSVFTVNVFSSKLCALADSEYESVADFEGTRLGVPSATSSQIPFVKAMLASAGLDPETAAELVPTGFGAAAAEALTRGDVAAIGYWGGYYIETEEMGFSYKCFTLPGMEAAPGHVIATLESTLAERPDLVERFGRAYAKGVYYASTHPEGTVRAYWAAYPDAKPVDTPEEDAVAAGGRVVEKSVAEFFFDYPGWMLGYNSIEGWTAMVQYMVDSAQIEQSVPADELINNDYIEAMNNWDPAEIEALPDPQ